MNPETITIEVGALSETGYVREENQDRMSGSSIPLGRLFIVADGMGGHKSGALAAQLTVQGLQKHIGESKADAPVEDVFRSAFNKVNQEVHKKAQTNAPETQGMGSTALVLLIRERVAWLAHVGDSRAYLYRDRRLKQLTKDHTLVQQMVDAGMLPPQNAASHPNASVLSQAMGTKPQVEVDISAPLPLREGDGLLMCSDGLSGYVADSEIEGVLQSGATVQEATRRLVDTALLEGGKDNITVQWIRFGNPQDGRQHRRATPTRPPPRSLMVLLATALLATAVALYNAYLYATIEKDRWALGAEIGSLTSELSAKVKTIAALTSQTTEKSAQVEEFSGEAERLQKSLATLRAEKRKIKKRVQAAEKEKHQLTDANNKLKAELEETEAMLKTLQADAARERKKAAVDEQKKTFKVNVFGKTKTENPLVEMARLLGPIEISWFPEERLAALHAQGITGKEVPTLYYTANPLRPEIEKLVRYLKRYNPDAKKERLASDSVPADLSAHALIVMGGTDEGGEKP